MGLFDDFANCISDFGRIINGEQPLHLKNHRAEDNTPRPTRASTGTSRADPGSEQDEEAQRNRAVRQKREEEEEEARRNRDAQAIEDALIIMTAHDMTRRR